MRRDIDLVVTALAAVACACAAFVPVVRVAGGLLLLFVLPGYALSPLIVPFRGRISPPLWTAMWTAGLSLAVAVLGGLLLNLTPAGLTRVTWAVSLAGFTVVAAGVSTWWRRRSGASAWSFTAAVPRWTPVTRLATGYAAAAVAIGGAAIGLAVASAGWQHSPGFAQLWLVPGQNAAGADQATLGVRSGYDGSRSFHVVLRRGSVAISSWDFSLGAGQTWQRTLTEPAGQRLTAELTGVAGGQAAPQTVTITSS